MKRIDILLSVSLMFTSIVFAQDYDKFKLGLGAGYAGGTAPSSSLRKDGRGALLTLEPAYRVSDALAIGLRLEAALYGTSGAASLPSGFFSITINCQYYLNADELVRPFVGAGLGSYMHDEGAFGFYPRLGFDYGHFTLALEYNLIPGALSDFNYLTNSYSTFSAYYVGIRVGGFFFGGKK